MNISTNLESAALYFPLLPALCENGQEITYRAFNEKVNRVATGLLASGVKPGDLIGLLAPNSTDWVIFYFGVLKAGAVAVTFSSLLSREEMTLLIQHANPRFLFATEDKLGDIQNLRGGGGLEKIICQNGELELQQLMAKGSGSFKALDRDRADTAAILYTGGTTGTPKGVMLTHENINVSSHNVAFSERSTEADRALCFLPFNHVFGQVHIMNATIISCGCLEILPAFDLDLILDITQSGRVTKLFAVPTVYTRLLNIDGIKEKLGKVRYCFSAAASMAAEIVRQWKEQTGRTIYEGYGLTESASAVTYNHYYHHAIGSVGTTVPGVEVQIRDEHGNKVEQGEEGEICIRGHNIMKGYLNNPEDTRSAFWDVNWFRSGDVGHVDGNGHLYIVDRMKDLIITGGENVYPREVEEQLYARPEVEECSVIGVPDKEWGERVVACIVPKPGRKVVPEELKTFLKSQLSSFKVPKEYIVLSELPKSPAGKILKREVKKKFLEGTTAVAKGGTERSQRPRRSSKS
ncbi:MAG: AMP-binding protein [Deltaproteobacteria bacterium RBG_16_54_18]|nr:MAG: AMP-binding protein [Deltaproteobacteria bacterium RBG_16_54_18]